ncbi:hypothetical protein ACFWOG_29180 [Kitasatospora sp. NPDC058406]|uniref:hypothetical protein n=1 Tax=Kitasatospora sp. NPDC058406 TaxID=3346483 RepID=UPI0036550BC3
MAQVTERIEPTAVVKATPLSQQGASGFHVVGRTPIEPGMVVRHTDAPSRGLTVTRYTRAASGVIFAPAREEFARVALECMVAAPSRTGA